MTVKCLVDKFGGFQLWFPWKRQLRAFELTTRGCVLCRRWLNQSDSPLFSFEFTASTSGWTFTGESPAVNYANDQPPTNETAAGHEHWLQHKQQMKSLPAAHTNQNCGNEFHWKWFAGSTRLGRRVNGERGRRVALQSAIIDNTVQRQQPKKNERLGSGQVRTAKCHWHRQMAPSRRCYDIRCRNFVLFFSSIIAALSFEQINSDNYFFILNKRLLQINSEFVGCSLVESPLN